MFNANSDDAPTVNVQGTSDGSSETTAMASASNSGSQEAGADPRIPFKPGTYEFWKYKVENKVVGDPNSTVTITTEGCTCSCFVVDPKASDAFDCSCKCPQTEQGNNGDKGEKGQKGSTGSQGPRGRMGYTGSKGYKGDVGQKGPNGQTGIQGMMGPAGDDGKDGGNVQGPRGEKGSTGKPPRGLPGARGDDGPSGPQGLVGNVGRPVAGAQGIRGARGPRGITGARGRTGGSGRVGSLGPRGGLGPRGLSRQTGQSAEQRRVAVQAACVSMAKPGSVVTAVQRRCSGSGPSCASVCRGIHKYTKDFLWRGEDGTCLKNG